MSTMDFRTGDTAEIAEPPAWDAGSGLYFQAAGDWRNGREAGAWAAGIAAASLGQRVHVEFDRDQVDGAVTSLVHAACTVRPYSQSDGWSSQTLEIWYAV